MLTGGFVELRQCAPPSAVPNNMERPADVAKTGMPGDDKNQAKFLEDKSNRPEVGNS